MFCHCFLSVLTTVPVVLFVAHLFLLSVFGRVSARLTITLFHSLTIVALPTLTDAHAPLLSLLSVFMVLS